MNIMNAGLELTVFDVRRERLATFEALGAYCAADTLEVAQRADIICIAVIDDAQLHGVLCDPNGVLAGAKPGAIIVIHSTVSPETCQQLAKRCAEAGAALVDAPVSGAASGAKAGTLALLVGGEQEHVDECQPLFAAISDRVFHLGPVGTGQIAKICNNLMFTVNLRAALEALDIATSAGLNENDFRAICAGTTAQSWSLDNVDDMRELLNGSMQSRDAVEIGNKDLALASQLADAVGVKARLSKLAQVQGE